MTDRGPLRSYEVTWRSGAAEVVQGHQVLLDSPGFLSGTERWFRIHGEFGGLEKDITCIRDVTGRA